MGGTPQARTPQRVRKQAAFKVERILLCGIAGIVDLTGRRAVSEEVVGKMVSAIVHRGPDEEGFFFLCEGH